MYLDLPTVLNKILNKYGDYIQDSRTRLTLLAELRSIHILVLEGQMTLDEAEKAVRELLDILLPEGTPEDVKNGIVEEYMKLLRYHFRTRVVTRQRRAGTGFSL